MIGRGRADPSRESREHAVWEEDGLVTVTGGKLTTFQLLAQDALRAARQRLPTPALPGRRPGPGPSPADWPDLSGLESGVRRRLVGRYGPEAPALIAMARPGELECIPGTSVLWAQLRFAASAEGVEHLDDLLLRRVRLGLLLPEGAAALLPRLRTVCQEELGWSDARWQSEEDAYRRLWSSRYSLPDRSQIPDWRRPPPPRSRRAGVLRRRIATEREGRSGAS